MTLDAYPDDAEIVETNFKTAQQEQAAEKIAEEWPVDLNRLAEEGQHVKMFYKQVLDQFLGPAEEEATFAALKDEYGGLEQWADSDDEPDAVEEDDVDVPDVEDIEPGAGDTSGETNEGTTSIQETEDSVTATIDIDSDGDVDDRRRAWFRAGFREGVEFALENPELFERD